MQLRHNRALPKQLGRVILRQIFAAVESSQPAKSLAPAPHFLPHRESTTIRELAQFAQAADFDTRRGDKHTENRAVVSV
ncbi:MAG: hypothetical protein JNM18_07430 [Planctomycetaceae bacterium]|nr:hypothetical protein [Planctomycetaceae bacterium]